MRNFVPRKPIFRANFVLQMCHPKIPSWWTFRPQKRKLPPPPTPKKLPSSPQTPSRHLAPPPPGTPAPSCDFSKPPPPAPYTFAPFEFEPQETLEKQLKLAQKHSNRQGISFVRKDQGNKGMEDQGALWKHSLGHFSDQAGEFRPRRKNSPPALQTPPFFLLLSIPELPRKFFGDFPGSSLTVELKK